MTARLLPPMQFIRALSPKYHEPTHLARLVGLFERIARGEQVHAVVSVPPGHEKTETLAHCFVWMLKQRPALRGFYGTYGQRLSTKKSRRIRQLAARAGIRIDRSSASTSDWRTGVEEGGLWASSVGGSVVGERFDLVMLDDLVKDRIAAENALLRERTYDWTVELAGREEPNASSVLIMHAWHVDDVGRRLIRDGWEDISCPALDDEGRALCPLRYTAEQLRKIQARIGDYAFDSLYLQRPRPRGGAIFVDCHTYDCLPEGVTLFVVGCDFAYSTRSSADFSCAVVLATDGDTCWVVEVVRLRTTAPMFHAELERLRRDHDKAELYAYASGTEKGAIDMMIDRGLPLQTQPAIADKFTRALPAAAAWNAGKILVPARREPWRDAFVSEICGFTGTKADRHDDQVDALAAAFDAARSFNSHGSHAGVVYGSGTRWGDDVRGF